MKHIINTFLFFAIVLNVHSQNDDLSTYYWYKGKKIQLKEDENIKYYLLDQSFMFDDIDKIRNQFEIINFGFDDAVKTLNPYHSKAKNENLNKWLTLKCLEGNQTVELLDDYKIYESTGFRGDNGYIGLSHLFYVKLNQLNDTIILNQLAKENNVHLIGNNKYMPLWFTLSCTNKSKMNSLEMANYFYESGLFSSSVPDFLTDDAPNSNCVNDTFFVSQWGLQNLGNNNGTYGVDINYCEARQITSGNQNVIVAVLDHGIEMNHPDLTNIHSVSFDTESGSSPSLVLGSHGTACAGIIGANANNNIGVAGIAPNCPLMSISNSLLGTPNSRQRRADGINFAWQNGAAIISNSWSSGVMYPIIDDAIEEALTQGRNGLGTIVVFSSGNDDGPVSYPANSHPDILAVGAVDRCGVRSGRIDIIPNSCDPWPPNSRPASQFGSELDVVAPGSSVYTTDRTGSDGYTSSDYDPNFGGTSAACPYVAGLAGLILSLDPCLTVQEVNDIIESTAQKVNTANVTYSTTAGRPNGTWNNELGYGLIDAEAALNLTLTKFLQNDTETGSVLVASQGHIRAGKNVNPSIGTGPYTISSGADVEFKATQSIRLEPGFTASAGSNFLAHIEAFNGDCNQWNSKNLWFQEEDEVIEASTTESISVKEVETASFLNPLFFPNPYNEALYVKYDLENDGEVIIQLYDLSGRTIYTKTFQGHSGQNMHLIDFNTEAKVLIAKTCVIGDCKTTKLIKGNEQ